MTSTMTLQTGSSEAVKPSQRPHSGPANGHEPFPARAAQLTGFAYLMTAVTGVLSYFVVRPQLVVADDGPETLLRLVDNENLARIGLVIDLGLITSGIVAALLFFAMFRSVDSRLGLSLVAFATVGAALISVATIFAAGALQVAVSGPGFGGDSADIVLLLTRLYDVTWSIGALFFGLWLIPMGLLALRSGWMPRALGWTLVIGGVGYMVSAAVDQLQPESETLVELLTMPASIGEFWMMLYLVFRGTFPKSVAD